jgi:hypothetical protein
MFEVFKIFNKILVKVVMVLCVQSIVEYISVFCHRKDSTTKYRNIFHNRLNTEYHYDYEKDFIKYFKDCKHFILSYLILLNINISYKYLYDCAVICVQQNIPNEFDGCYLKQNFGCYISVLV